MCLPGSVAPIALKNLPTPSGRGLSCRCLAIVSLVTVDLAWGIWMLGVPYCFVAHCVAALASSPGTKSVERQCWEVVCHLTAHGAKPHDNHKQPEAFILATSKEWAVERARKSQGRTIEGQDFLNPRQGRVCRGRGCHAASSGGKRRR